MLVHKLSFSELQKLKGQPLPYLEYRDYPFTVRTIEVNGVLLNGIYNSLLEFDDSKFGSILFLDQEGKEVSRIAISAGAFLGVCGYNVFFINGFVQRVCIEQDLFYNPKWTRKIKGE